MVAIITEHGDFDVAISFEELDSLLSIPIEDELLKEGEIPIKKRVRILVEADAEKMVDKRALPKDDSLWDEVTTFELVINQKAYNMLNTDGNVLGEVYTISIFIQVSNSLACRN